MPLNDKRSAVALDLGTSRVCLAHRMGEELSYETQLNAFVAIPYSKVTENVLQKGNVPHTVSSEIVVHGNRRMDDVLPFMPVPPMAFTNPVYVVRHAVAPPPYPGVAAGRPPPATP